MYTNNPRSTVNKIIIIIITEKSMQWRLPYAQAHVKIIFVLGRQLTYLKILKVNKFMQNVLITLPLKKNFENTDLKKYWSCNHNIYGFRNNLEKFYS